mmetsp:Transcript_24268/g.54579  ORF Transcript_24268/g.54579 Transcript_24268/m.54579 type:complete len:206 (-) Transcript_24268:1246-1863(-)
MTQHRELRTGIKYRPESPPGKTRTPALLHQPGQRPSQRAGSQRNQPLSRLLQPSCPTDREFSHRQECRSPPTGRRGTSTSWTGTMSSRWERPSPSCALTGRSGLVTSSMSTPGVAPQPRMTCRWTRKALSTRAGMRIPFTRLRMTSARSESCWRPSPTPDGSELACSSKGLLDKPNLQLGLSGRGPVNKSSRRACEATSCRPAWE